MCFLTTNRLSKAGIAGFAAIVVMLSLPGSAMAAFTMEYYTYGGFSEVVDAFTKCALIFSSNSYQVLLPSVFCLSLMVSLVGAALYRAQTAVKDEGVAVSRPEGFFSAIVNPLIGTAIFMGLVVPTGTLQIYDPTQNTTQAVGGIPFIAVCAAGGANLVERSVVSLIDTAGSPLGYSKQSGLKGVQVMNALMVRGDEAPTGDKALGHTLQNYVNDCVLVDMSLAGSTLTIDELSNGTDSLAETSFPKAASPAMPTTVYDPSLDPSGVPMSCQDAWTNIAARSANIGTSNLFGETIKRACADGGYDVYNPDPTIASLSFNECKSSTGALITAIDGGWDLNTFMLEMYYVNQFWVALSKSNASAFANKPTVTNGQSVLQEYLSTMAQKRGMITAFAAVLLPFIALLLPTKYWPKATGGIVTAFLICPIWGTLDALTTDFYLTRAVSTWTVFLGNHWGVDELALWNSSALKQMSTWGVYVAASFAIALSSAKMVSGQLGSVVGGFGGAGAARAEGRLDMGKTGLGAEARERVSTGAGLSNAAVMANNAAALTAGMPAWDGGHQFQHKLGTNLGEFSGNERSLTFAGGTDGVAGMVSNNTVGKFAHDGGVGIAQSADLNKTVEAGRFDTGARIEGTNAVSAAAGGDYQSQGVVDQAARVVSTNLTPDKAVHIARNDQGVNIARNQAEENESKLLADKWGVTLPEARQFRADFAQMSDAGKQLAMENMYQKLNETSQFKGDKHDFMQQSQATGSVVLDDGTKLSFAQAKDGRFQGTGEKVGNGYTKSTTSVDGVGQTTFLENKGAWSASLDKDNNLLVNDNKALAGSIQSSVTAKATQQLADTWHKDVVAAHQKGSSTEHSTGSQKTRARVQAWSKEMASSLAKSLVKSGAITEDKRVANEAKIAAALSVDPIKAGGFMAGIVGGPGGQGFGAAMGGLASLAASAIGLKTELSASGARSSTSGTTSQSALTNAATQAVTNASKEAVTESSTKSQTVADIRKELVSNTYTDQSGHQHNYGKSLSFDESKGFTTTAETMTGFVKEMSERDEYKHLSPEERIAAANNDIAKLENRDRITGMYSDYLEKKALEDGKISAVNNSIQTGGANLAGNVQQVERNMDKSLTNALKGPDSAPQMTMAPAVASTAAQLNSNVNAGAVYNSEANSKISMFNFDTPSPEGGARSINPSATVEPGTAALNTFGSQPKAPTTTAARIAQPVVNTANAVYNTTPVQVGTKIVSGLAGSVPKVMDGLNKLGSP